MSVQGSLRGQCWSQLSQPPDTDPLTGAAQPASVRISPVPAPSDDVMKLPREDMTTFGRCPAWDNFVLVTCDKCDKIVKIEAFESHMTLRHGSKSERSAYHRVLAARAAASLESCEVTLPPLPASFSTATHSNSSSVEDHCSPATLHPLADAELPSSSCNSPQPSPSPSPDACHHSRLPFVHEDHSYCTINKADTKMTHTEAAAPPCSLVTESVCDITDETSCRIVNSSLCSPAPSADTPTPTLADTCEDVAEVELQRVCEEQLPPVCEEVEEQLIRNECGFVNETKCETQYEGACTPHYSTTLIGDGGERMILSWADSTTDLNQAFTMQPGECSLCDILSIFYLMSSIQYNILSF